jgi:hypothetical protein
MTLCENYNSTPRAANVDKSADPILHRESLLFKTRGNATGYFKNQGGVGVP